VVHCSCSCNTQSCDSHWQVAHRMAFVVRHGDAMWRRNCLYSVALPNRIGSRHESKHRANETHKNVEIHDSDCDWIDLAREREEAEEAEDAATRVRPRFMKTWQANAQITIKCYSRNRPEQQQQQQQLGIELLVNQNKAIQQQARHPNQQANTQS
jgi:hypothetical protein